MKLVWRQMKNNEARLTYQISFSRVKVICQMNFNLTSDELHFWAGYQYRKVDIVRLFLLWSIYSVQANYGSWKRIFEAGYLEEDEYEFGVAQIETSSRIIFKDLFCHYLLICREQVQILKWFQKCSKIWIFS